MKRLALTLILVLLLNLNSLAADVIFSQKDQTGDEYGTGKYTYPTSQQFMPYRGLFDLSYFKLECEGDLYNLYFEFKEVSNPWQAPNGFSHQLIQLYIDNQKGGRFDTLKEGANVRFEKKHPWNRMVKITGWAIEVYDTEGLIKEEQANVERIDQRTIKAQIPKESLGDLSQAYYYVLIGAFDYFASDNYRKVGKKASGWQFGGGLDSKINPNVLDILTPEGICQKRVLSSYDQETESYAVLRAVGPEPSLSVKVTIIFGFLFLLIASLVGVVAKLIFDLAKEYGYFN